MGPERKIRVNRRAESQRLGIRQHFNAWAAREIKAHLVLETGA